jgi:acetate kinase
MIAALGGLDLLVFTGGIGENDAEVRAAICGGLTWAGVSPDIARNRAANSAPDAPPSRSRVEVIASQEDEQIARHTWALAPLTSSR